MPVTFAGNFISWMTAPVFLSSARNMGPPAPGGTAYMPPPSAVKRSVFVSRIGACSGLPALRRERLCGRGPLAGDLRLRDGALLDRPNGLAGDPVEDIDPCLF